ncbi:hypothetical protein DEO72_LG8g2454 [Vigna unguiculata]|uniref:GRF-type domain-containing protein n=1 Tax=Vigna unguiculata TaxID=3917 RepID=A0A4D6MTJ8_VIGUN|nr:hypothetical protein DEO72_LG8g2454 [Vigna unguiculata]
MSRTQSSSLYSNNCVQRSFPSSEGGGRMVLGLRPICDCGEVVVLRTARTPKNVGRKFWCFANYKRESEAGVWCNFSNGGMKILMKKKMLLSSTKT